jgi:hypothetical protein
MASSLHEQMLERLRNEFLNMWYGGVFTKYWFANRSSFEDDYKQDHKTRV